MKNIQSFFLISLIIAVGIGAYLVFKPFIIALLLAFILSQLFRKWYLFFKKKTSHGTVASLTTCLLVFLIIVIPLFLSMGLIAKEVQQLYEKSKQNGYFLNIENYVIDNPYLEEIGITAENFSFQSLLSSDKASQTAENAQRISGFFLSALKKTYQGTSHFLFVSFITFFALYYFFKDGDRMMRKIMDLSPLPNNQEKKLIIKFMSISRATLKGSLVIAIIQGVLMALLFAATDVGSPAIWGLITAILSLIPLLGVVLVWLPVGLFMLFSGAIWEAIVIFSVGGILLSNIDNFLRPKLVGDDASLHPLLVLLSTLGGIAAFGAIGFLIGPIIIVLLLALLDIYKVEFKKDLDNIN